MTTYIAWHPHTPETAFPQAFLDGDRLDMYHPSVESESCPKCSFTVRWAQDKEDFEEHNEDTRRRIREQLELQVERGECPDHPIPTFISQS